MDYLSDDYYFGLSADQVTNIAISVAKEVLPSYKQALIEAHPSRIEDEDEDTKILVNRIVREFYEGYYYPKLRPDVYRMEEIIYNSKKVHFK